MKKEAKVKYWKSQGVSLVNSFKNIPTKQFLKAALFDFLTLISVIVILSLSFRVINLTGASAIPQLVSAYSLKQSGDSQAFTNALAELAPAVNKVLLLSLIIGLVAFVLCVFFISWFYGKAWCAAMSKQFSVRYLKKYLLLNLLWFIFLILILLVTMIFIKTETAAVLILIELILIFYLDPVLRSVFDEKKNLGANIAEFLRIAKFLNWFIIPIIIAIIIFFILLAALGLLASIKALFIILFFMFAITFMGWMRNYISQLVNFINQKHKV